MSPLMKYVKFTSRCRTSGDVSRAPSGAPNPTFEPLEVKSYLSRDSWPVTLGALPWEAGSRGHVSRPCPGPAGPSGRRTVSLDMRQSSFFGGVTHTQRSSSLPSALREPVSHHQRRLGDTKQNNRVITQLETAVCLFTRRLSDVELQ